MLCPQRNSNNNKVAAPTRGAWPHPPFTSGSGSGGSGHYVDNKELDILETTLLRVPPAAPTPVFVLQPSPSAAFPLPTVRVGGWGGPSNPARRDGVPPCRDP